MGGKRGVESPACAKIQPYDHETPFNGSPPTVYLCVTCVVREMGAY